MPLAVVWPLFPVEKVRHQLSGHQGNAASLYLSLERPSGIHLCSSPTRPPAQNTCFLSPVLPPGRWLSGPGIERSQENSRRDPGEGQHCGECAGTTPLAGASSPTLGCFILVPALSTRLVVGVTSPPAKRERADVSLHKLWC